MYRERERERPARQPQTLTLTLRPLSSGRKTGRSSRPWDCRSRAIDYEIVPGSFPNPVAELECVTLPWRLLQEA